MAARRVGGRVSVVWFASAGGADRHAEARRVTVTQAETEPVVLLGLPDGLVDGGA
jgi:hypothetical protein